MQKKTWIAVSAASALGIGVIAGGAVATANAMELTSDDTRVPGLTNVDDVRGDDSRGSADVTFDVTSDSIVTPDPATSASPVTPATPATPVTPASVVTPPTPASPVSPVTPPSPVSPASPVTPASPVSVDDDGDDD
ncbi:hypothetical protein [Microcella alkalica]|uniref:hypothetical protein n=1 Tax=Microcella alkalica TaxID=355930 RepID=UPI00145E1A12|nr:hypothetical protein [Microcella alkalica]